MMLVFIATILLLSFGNAQSGRIAEAKLHLDASQDRMGYLWFMQRDSDSSVTIKGRIWNLGPNTVHGFHVHEYPLVNGNLNCTAAGPHFNPHNTTHGPITADINNRHVGDLGNVTSDNYGVININITDSIIQLSNGERSIVNRTIILHAMRDDGGMGGFPDSSTTGNAGARIACGNIMFSWRRPMHDD